MRRRASPAKRDDEPLAQLRAAVATVVGSSAAAEVLQGFSRYLDVLTRWNRVHRLIGPRSPGAIVRDLFIDSLAFLKVLPSGPISIVDLGTGVGIPGIPIRLVRPEVALTLVESRNKCVSFLGDAKRQLGLTDVRVMGGRAEVLLEQNPELRGACDVAISRGVGPAILSTALDWVRPGGAIVLSGPPPGTRAVDPESGLEEVIVSGPLGKRAFLISRRD